MEDYSAVSAQTFLSPFHFGSLEWNQQSRPCRFVSQVFRRPRTLSLEKHHRAEPAAEPVSRNHRATLVLLRVEVRTAFVTPPSFAVLCGAAVPVKGGARVRRSG